MYWDFFHSSGMTSVRSNSLYNAVSGSTISLDISFKKRADKPSGPVALVVSNDDK